MSPVPELPLLFPSEDKCRLPEQEGRKRGIDSHRCEAEILPVLAAFHNGPAMSARVRKPLFDKHLRDVDHWRAIFLFNGPERCQPQSRAFKLGESERKVIRRRRIR